MFNQFTLIKIAKYLDDKSVANLSKCSAGLHDMLIPVLQHRLTRKHNASRFELIESFIKYTNKINSRRGNNELTRQLLRQAIKSHNLDSVVHLVTSIKPTSCDLLTAVIYNSACIVEYLIHRGVPITAQHLDNAVVNGNYRIVNVLLNEGNPQLKTAAQYAISGCRANISALLVQHGAMLTASLYRHVAEHNLLDSIKLLFKLDTCITTRKVNTILSVAIAYKHNRIAKYILAAVDINSFHLQLMLDAIMLNRYVILKHMLKNGMDYTANNYKAIQYARKFGGNKIIKLLNSMQLNYYRDGSRKYSGGL